MAIKDFFKYKATRDKISNCGILRPYLDGFSTWLTQQEYPVATTARHLTNIAHFSYYLNRTEISCALESLDKYLHEFKERHIPRCTCHGWNNMRNERSINYSLNRFKQFLSADLKISFSHEDIPYHSILKQYLSWLSDNQVSQGIMGIRGNYLKKFLKRHYKKYGLNDFKTLKPYDVEHFVSTQL